MKNYKVREKPRESERKELKEYSEMLQELLFFRGIKTGEEAEKFLNPDFDLHVHDPYLLKDMDKAVDRILKAVEKNEKIVIWSDYDADGIPGGVVIHDFFKKIGFNNFRNYIPDRNGDGFGLNIPGLEEIAKENCKTLITVDCGINDIEAVKRANELGIDVIITDHHIPGDTVPEAFAIINPKQEDCKYPEKMLCGGGVAFKFVQAIIKKNSFSLKEGWEKWLLDMVGISTLSDMVPLTGENRVFSYYGLKVLRKSPRLGLIRLLRELNISKRDLAEDDIGFSIAPRINAASRMGVARDAFRLLTTSDEIEAEEVSRHLDKINNERKGAVAAMVKEIKHRLQEKIKNQEEKLKIIVMGNPSWKPSLLGLAANTLSGEHDCPVFIWGREGENNIKGSCRSNGVSLISLMQAVSAGTFSGFGGHNLSGGFSVDNDRIHFLEEELYRALEKIEILAEEKNPDWIDRKLDINDVSWNTWKEIDKLAPFGTGNPKPLFLFEKIQIHRVERFGKEKNHLKLIFKKENSDPVSAIAFFSSPKNYEALVEAGSRVDLVASIEKSFFRNYPELRLRIVDIL